MVVITLFCYNKGYVMQKTSLSMKSLNKAGEFEDHPTLLQEMLSFQP